MKILILAAMDKEISLLLNLLERPAEKEINSLNFMYGNVSGNEIYLSKCGIGKVNAALNTLKFIQTINPDLVLNSGVAGGAGLPIGTLLVADKAAYHDVWCGPGTIYGQADGFPLFMPTSRRIIDITGSSNIEQGLICSGDKFISTSEEISFIKSKFPDVKAVDMESASIVQTCMECGVEVSIIRVISDTPGEGENISQYKDFWQKAPEKTFSVIESIVKAL